MQRPVSTPLRTACGPAGPPSFTPPSGGGPRGGGRWRARIIAGSLPGLHVVVGAVLSLLLLIACGPRAAKDGAGQNLLRGMMPAAAEGVVRAEVLTDETADFDGGTWDSEITAILRSSRSSVSYDLGQARPIARAYLQADNDDRYVLEISEDGQRYVQLWRADPVKRPGLRDRRSPPLDGVARYVRLRAEGGDGRFALSELQLWSDPSAAPAPRRQRGLPAGKSLQSSMLLFGLVLGATVVLSYRGARFWWTAALCAICLWAAGDLGARLFGLAAADARSVSMLRAVAAAVAAVAVLREAFAPRRFPASKGIVMGTLAVCAGLSLLSFLNLGRPQFYDHARAQPSFVHSFDMRVYFPQAKYFDELGFDGVYLASVAAYADNQRDGLLGPLAATQLRDLTTHRMVRVADVEKDVMGVKGRFTPARWQEFLRDMRYFQASMGPDFLRSMHDHGGNATPVWIAIARLLFAEAPASEGLLLVGAALDPLMLLLTFVAIGWCFGPRTALVACVVFGANDFYMFGTNWSGATLRHDWMVYLGLGACALRRRWFFSAGVLLALAALIRAFPGLVAVAAALPAVFWFLDRRRTEGRWPSFSALWREHAGLLRVAAGALVCVIVGVVVTSLWFGADRWIEWWNKVRLLSKDPHVNHIGLRGLVAGAEHGQLALLQARMPVYVALAGLFTAGVVIACRRKSYEQAAVLGILLVPIVFYPANYYLHAVFLLPLVAVERRARGGAPALTLRDGLLWAILLGLCWAQYFTVLVADLDLHFYLATVLLFTAMTGLLAVILGQDYLQHWLPVAESRPAEAPDGSVAPISVAPRPTAAILPELGATSDPAGVDAAMELGRDPVAPDGFSRRSC